jgi:hypothetical protein
MGKSATNLKESDAYRVEGVGDEGEGVLPLGPHELVVEGVHHPS